VTTTAVTLSHSAYVRQSGRVGLWANFIDRDAVIYDLSSTAFGFATLLSRVYPSSTPVKGAQLQAVYSGDSNLFSNWSDVQAIEFFIDKSKTTSGTGSRRTRNGLISNQFLVERW
jgi:hypothetical protein